MALYANNLKRFGKHKQNKWAKIIEKNPDIFKIEKFLTQKKKVYKKHDSTLLEEKKFQDYKNKVRSKSPLERKNLAFAQIKDNGDRLLEEIRKDNIRFRKGIVKEIPKKIVPMDM